MSAKVGKSREQASCWRPAPKITVRGFNFRSQHVVRSILGHDKKKDKRTSPVTEKEDQNTNLSSFSATARGVTINVSQEDTFSSSEYPGGFRWVQTVTTNDPGWTPVGAPLQNPAVTYVDPKPNDDTKPFYWTDQEFIDNGTDFEDTPSRPAHPTGTINWDATLSLVGVNGTTITHFDSLSYGFSRASDGTVTERAPTSPANLAVHVSAFKSDFPGWTYT